MEPPRFARWSLASLGGTASLPSLGGGRPRFARRRDGLASLGWRPLKTVPPRANTPGICTCAPERNGTDPPLKFSGLLVWFHQKPENLGGKKKLPLGRPSFFDFCVPEIKKIKKLAAANPLLGLMKNFFWKKRFFDLVFSRRFLRTKLLATFFFFFKCLIYLDPRTREKYKRNEMGNRPINP